MSNKRYAQILAGVVCFLLGMAISIYASAAEVSFKYVLPVTRVDGSKLTASQIKTCTLYKGATKVADMGKSGAYTYNEASAQTVTYSATCTDTAGVESAKSTTITLSFSPPLAPVLEVAP